MVSRPPLLALCGTSSSTLEEDSWADAVGRICADLGAVGLCGGLGGVMTSAAKGVTEAGGTCIGLLPGNEADAGNEYLSYAIPTGMGEMRNGLLARACVGMVAIGGGYGTLSEIGFARRLGKPVVCIGSWIVDLSTDPEPDPGLHRTTDPKEAMEWLWQKVQGQPVKA